MTTPIDGLEDAFVSFGGVPSELLFDQMKAVITRDLRLEGGALVCNAEFLRFAHHRGFLPRACRPYRAQTKGKVERPVRCLRGNLVYGRTFLHDADLDEQCQRWLARVANVRLHGTTHERPRDRFDREERFVLQPLPPRRYTSLILDRTPTSTPARRSPRPLVTVEKRSLAAYAQLAGGAKPQVCRGRSATTSDAPQYGISNAVECRGRQRWRWWGTGPRQSIDAIPSSTRRCCERPLRKSTHRDNFRDSRQNRPPEHAPHVPLSD